MNRHAFSSYLFLCLAFAFFPAFCQSYHVLPDVQIGKPKLLLISLDGFRHDYFDRIPTPHLHAIAKEGVTAPYIQNVFTTKTFPNHYSLVTGLYAESHGIVDNVFYDEDLNKTFDFTKDTGSEFWDVGASPLWILNQEQGEANSACIMWPGSNAEVHKKRPSYWFPYDESMPFRERIDHAINYFSNESLMVNAVFLYFEEPDESGHKFGPYSNELQDMVQKVDKEIGYLVAQLKQFNLYDKVNVIITSDHGMEEVREENVIELSKFLDDSLYTAIPKSSPVLHIYPTPGNYDTVFNTLREAAGKTVGMKVFAKSEIPEYWHYSQGSRIGQIIVVADPGYDIAIIKGNTSVYGQHGYDNRYPPMNPFFVARGPAFKKGFVSEPFESIHLYPLMCHILGLTPGPNNGSLVVVKELLDNTDSKTMLMINAVLIGVFSGLLIVCLAAAICGLVFANRRESSSVPLQQRIGDSNSSAIDPDDPLNTLDFDERQKLLEAEDQEI